MNNLFFLSGPHGSGKTTLSDLLREIPGVLTPDIEMRTPKFYSDVPQDEIDFFHRQELKHAERAIENYEYSEIARKNPDKIIIGNRCIYDVLVYDEAYSQRGWITEEQKEILKKNSEHLFGSLREPYAIILNTGIEACIRHLENRWKTKNKKFMESDMDYLSAVCSAFEDYRFYSNVYYIDHELDLGNKSEIERISEWIDSISGRVYA
ncbi:MAG: deoxynucleoside kinase [Nanoarchaeota archaeon]|nr:deoxynucleoside kinase [Nanoarchaeota archaeon]